MNKAMMVIFGVVVVLGTGMIFLAAAEPRGIAW